MMEKQSSAAKAKGATKANFDSIYLAADPRSYYRVLYGLDYIIPELARPVFRDLIAAKGQEGLEDKARPKIVDLGCSYGINAALIKHGVDLERLAHRCRDLDRADVSTDELIARDRLYFASWPREVDVDVIGLDVSQPAINYAQRAGLIDHGWALDLESRDLPRAAAEVLADVDMIVSTGCVGYVGERTFSRLLAAAARPPWVASLVLRMYSYEAIARRLAERGLVTEKLEGATFIQRRFHSPEEQRSVVDRLHVLGIDTRGKEEDGLYHAELFVSRPRADVARRPLTDLVSLTRGGERTYGGWRRLPWMN